MIIGAIDVGGGHPFPMPTTGQTIGNALIEGSRTIVWPRGRIVEKQDVTFWVRAWNGLGGNSDGYLAVRAMLAQLEELAGSPDLQPVYIQWAATAQSGQYNATTPHDGWYAVDNLQPDYSKFVVSGQVQVKMSASRAGAAAPSSLAAWYSGAALSSTYSATQSIVVAFPVGSTAPATSGSRAGGEGSIPIATLASAGPNPAPFVRPATIAGLYTGQVHVYDTINTGSNPVPTSGGTFVNSSWVEVFGTGHDFQGDCVITNGLLLLLYAVGSAPSPSVYFWNTSLGTPSWQLIGTIQYQDNAGNAGTVRAIDLDRVGLEEVRIRTRLSTSAGNWAMLKQKLQRGTYHAYCEFWPLSQANTSQLGLAWNAASAYATGFTESTSSTTFPSNLATTTTSGYAGAQASATASPIFGWLYQNIPTTAQGRLSSTSVFGLGDTSGPAQGSYQLYGFFAIPTTGAPSVATDRTTLAPIYSQYLFDRTVTWARG